MVELEEVGQARRVASSLSSRLMKPSWRRTRLWLRRPRLASDSVVLRRRSACSVASVHAVVWTRSSAAATECTSTLARRGTTTGGGGSGCWSSVPCWAWKTASGSRCVATASASWASIASGRVIERIAATTSATAPARQSSTRALRTTRRSVAPRRTAAARSRMSVPIDSSSARMSSSTVVSADHQDWGLMSSGLSSAEESARFSNSSASL
ncbi:hypothetical protein [Dactylosporangium darangshiense]|uniref:hypothetical protein n=1 Tax=Dactylosporangium darangshiense TaxID=579108 RepID=UPI003627662A